LTGSYSGQLHLIDPDGAEIYQAEPMELDPRGAAVRQPPSREPEGRVPVESARAFYEAAQELGMANLQYVEDPARELLLPHTDF
jgi:hypothetical protein